MRLPSSWKVFAVLLPVGYLAMVLGTAIHEVLGHGLAALAVGGTFTGFVVRFAGGGHAWAYAAPGSPLWHHVVVLAAGVVVETLVGAAMCLYASRRKVDSASGLVLSLLGLWLLASGPEYFFWSGLQLEGPGDASQILQRLPRAGFEVAIVRVCTLPAAAALFLFSLWWGTRLLWRHVETHLGRGQPLSPRRRAAVLVGLFVIPEAIVSHLLALNPAMGPGLGRLPAHVETVLLLLVAALVARFPLPPFPTPFVVTRWHVIGAWCAAGLAVLCVGLWLNTGVRWEWGEEAAARDRLDVFQQAVADWKAGRTDEARRKFEQAGSVGVLMFVSLLWEAGEDQAAVEAAERFAATSHDDDSSQSTAWHVVGMTNERTGNWTRALEAWEKSVPSEYPLAASWDGPISRLLRIARCRFRLGEVDAALALVEQCLKDPAALTPPSLALEASAAYAEYAARGDRLDRARAFAAGLAEPARTMCGDAFRIVAAWLTKSPAAVLDEVSEVSTDEHIELAGRLLGEMGDPAADLLLRRIRWRDVLAVKLAGHSGLTALVPALEERKAAAGRDAEAAGIAISQIERAAAQSRRAWRPPSRPTSRLSESR